MATAFLRTFAGTHITNLSGPLWQVIPVIKPLAIRIDDARSLQAVMTAGTDGETGATWRMAVPLFAVLIISRSD